MVDTEAEASERSGASEKRTVRCTMAGQHRPKPAPWSNPQVTMPSNDPVGTT